MTGVPHANEPITSAAMRRSASRHPVNRAMREEAPRGARVADQVTTFLGSWRFIAIQTVIVAIWIVGNVILLFDTRAADVQPELDTKASPDLT